MYQESIYRYELIALILCISVESFPQTMSKEHLRGKYYLSNLCIMHLMSFVGYWNDPICIEVLAPKLFWILQGYVGMGCCLTLCIPTRVSFKGFCDGSQSDSHPENNLGKFGYILDMKVEKKQNPFIFQAIY